MTQRAKPDSGRGRRRLSGLVIAILLAALVGLVPGSPATAEGDAGEGKVRKSGTLGDGYFFVATDGGIFNFGDSEFKGSTGDIALNKPIVGAESTPTGEGYWLVASDGGIFTFGDAAFLGSTGDIALNKPIVAMAATPTGKGYWLFATDGGVFTFGDAGFHGSAGAIALNKPIVGADATPTGLGYYLVASDGGIFTFGDAEFFGSAGDIKLNQPIVGMAALDDGDGYYLVATDGGIFSYGRTKEDARFFGSTGDIKLNQPIVGMDLSASNQGYHLVAADGGIFSFGDAKFLGSTGSIKLNKPIVGMTVTPNSPVTAPDFVVSLRGSKEVPKVGDPDASGFALLDFTDDELCYNLKVNSVGQASAAHIHEAPSGQAGPVLITLETPDANGTSVACQDVDPAIVADILDNPQNYYVNVHNPEFKGGAARGQVRGEAAVAATADNRLVLFDTENPATVASVDITGLGVGETLVGLDYRPKNDVLYGLVRTGNTGGRIYTINEDTGAATLIGAFTLPLTNDFATATAFGFDFNPVSDRIRIVTDANDSIQVDPDTGALFKSDNNLNSTYGDGDPDVVGVAYTRNFDQAAIAEADRKTGLLGIDSDDDVLVGITIDSGATASLAPLLFNHGAAFDAGDLLGFDIAPSRAAEPVGAAIMVSLAGTGANAAVYALTTTDAPETASNELGRVATLGPLPEGLVLSALTIA